MRINILYIIFLLYLFTIFTATVSAHNIQGNEKEDYYPKRSKLLPSHQKIQYAGGIGLFSLGVGWSYGKNNQWETDIMLGFLPKYTTNHSKLTFTFKQNFIPWEKKINPNLSFEPLSCGLYINSISGRNFWISQPEKYPNYYYTFSTRIRLWIYIGQRITYQLPSQNKFIPKGITVFYEISSNDIYLKNAFTNSSLKPNDYLRLSFGLKLQLF